MQSYSSELFEPLSLVNLTVEASSLLIDEFRFAEFYFQIALYRGV